MAKSCFSILQNPVQLEGKRAEGISRILERYGNHPQVNAEITTAERWSAEYFSLEKASRFSALARDAKASILKKLEQTIVGEIQLIEVAGMAFTAKMASLAPSVEERELYSFFAADEARHFQLISQISSPPDPETVKKNSFLRFIGELIDTQNPEPLVFFIQVFLEGWGIHYYGGLSRACKDLRTKQTLESIIKDEASHHGSGLLLFQEAKLPQQEQQFIQETMGFFLDAIRIGPQSLTKTLADACGGLSEAEVVQFLEEIEFQKKVATDLGYIRSILQKSDSVELLKRFEAKKAFELPNIKDCAKAIVSS